MHILCDIFYLFNAIRYKLRVSFFISSKQTSIEIEQLNARVVEAETKLKTEVTRIKKKLQIQITELELSLDVANKTNIDLQKTIKKQSLQVRESIASIVRCRNKRVHLTISIHKFHTKSSLNLRDRLL